MQRPEHVLDIVGMLDMLVGVPCSFVDSAGGWTVLRRLGDVPSTIFHFEARFHGQTQRNHYNAENVNAARRASSAFRSTWRGFENLFVPLRVGSRCDGVFVAGPFLTQELDARRILENWTTLAGTFPDRTDRRLALYARAALEVEVLNPKQLAGLEELLMLLGRALLGRHRLTHDRKRVMLLRNGIFGRTLRARRSKAETMIDEIRNLTWASGELADYEPAELGISHMPNVVLALMPRKPEATNLDAVSRLVNAVTFQRRVATLGERHAALSAPLDDYGAYLLFHLPRSRNRSQREQAVLERTQAIVASLERELQQRLAVGLGGSTEHAQELPACARRASVALQMAVLQDQRLLAYAAVERKRGQSGEERSPGAEIAALVELFATGVSADLEAAYTRYARSALWDARGQMSTVRTHLFGALDAILSRAESDSSIDANAASELRARFRETLEESNTTPALLDAFRDGARLLFGLARSNRTGALEFKLARAAGFVREHCQEPLTLEGVGRYVGLSSSYFSDRFKQRTGMGFAEFLLSARVERAKDLLRRSPLLIKAVAEQSGFKSVPHFAAAFKRLTGSTPSRYRSRLQAKAPSESRSNRNPKLR